MLKEKFFFAEPYTSIFMMTDGRRRRKSFRLLFFLCESYQRKADIFNQMRIYYYFMHLHQQNAIPTCIRSEQTTEENRRRKEIHERKSGEPPVPVLCAINGVHNEFHIFVGRSSFTDLHNTAINQMCVHVLRTHRAGRRNERRKMVI